MREVFVMDHASIPPKFEILDLQYVIDSEYAEHLSWYERRLFSSDPEGKSKSHQPLCRYEPCSMRDCDIIREEMAKHKTPPESVPPYSGSREDVKVHAVCRKLLERFYKEPIERRAADLGYAKGSSEYNKLKRPFLQCYALSRMNLGPVDPIANKRK